MAYRLFCCFAFCSTSLGLAHAQAPTPQNPPAAQPPAQKSASDQNQAEMASHDQPAMFKSRVNLVLVPVVVRDKQGKALGNLRLEDFQLFDKGKPQIISKFSLEKSAKPGKAAPASEGDAAEKTTPAPGDIPERFVAYLFDDVHVNFGDLARVRDAAGRHMASALQPTDRAAIYTTSGQVALDFTDDRDKLQAALARIQPRPLARSQMQECPDVSYYMGDLIQNKSDAFALQSAIVETMACLNLDPKDPASLQIARPQAQAAAQRAVTAGEHETRVALATIRDVVRRMAAMPGQRTVILASPGFITPDAYTEVTDVLDRAIRASVIINSLDARGLYTDTPDIAKLSYDANATSNKVQYDRESSRMQADVLAELASGTGGTFVQNTNDLEGGFQRVAAVPEYFYILGFSPQNLKLDGSYHSLKVTLKPAAGLTASARRGYFAPKHLEDATETAKREIEEALFSREEMSDIPVDLHTQFFKTSDDGATLAIVAHLDMKHVLLRKEDGRNRNVITIVSGVFDHNGNFVGGVTKTLELRLKDETVARLLGPGMSIKTNIEVKSGAYAIRLVVRDAEGQLMSAQNGAVEIP
ncbi:MAG: VWA domain-containing protein [Acidobacteriia bacterium]|nr:VWA domain-containing protein [Terriglobia bacterium]